MNYSDKPWKMPDGQHMPVPPWVVVQVRYRDGSTQFAMAQNVDWLDAGGPNDVAFYRGGDE